MFERTHVYMHHVLWTVLSSNPLTNSD